MINWLINICIKYRDRKKVLPDTFGIGEEIFLRWLDLTTRGWRIELLPTCKKCYPDFWGIFQAEYMLAKPRVIDGELAKMYFSRKEISNNLPFWAQFEMFIEEVEESYHQVIIPHMSGRTDGEPFDIVEDD